MGVSRSVVVAALAALAVLAAPASGAAGSFTERDSNDVRGRLDVKWARHGHAGADLVHTIATWRSFGGRVLRNGNVVVLALDTNGDRGDAEWWAQVAWRDGRLRGELFDTSFAVRTPIAVRRPASDRLQVSFPTAAIGEPRRYRWFAATIDGRNQDLAPSRGSVLHDLTPPTIRFTATRVVSAAVAAGDPVRVGFTVSDPGGAGLRDWRVERRAPGEPTWTRTGTRSGKRTVRVPTDAGETYEVRVVARDRQGNRSVSAAATFMPELAETFDGTSVAWISRQGRRWGTGEAVLDDTTSSGPVVLTAETTTLGVVAFAFQDLAPGTHTITIRPLEGDVAVDEISSG